MSMAFPIDAGNNSTVLLSFHRKSRPSKGREYITSATGVKKQKQENNNRQFKKFLFTDLLVRSARSIFETVRTDVNGER